ncbi:AraC family transcriptional regulator [Sphingomonadaceae bacterium]|nr:AraC family transcriptional regulator [Sphingomonadaceae bacterium]
MNSGNRIPATARDSERRIVIGHLSEPERLRTADVINFELIFQNLHDVYFYVKDATGRWISCNAASLNLLNFAKRSDVIGKWEKDFFPPRIAQAIQEDDAAILGQGKSILNRIEVIPDHNGELSWVQTNKLPIFGCDDAVIGLIGITRPILPDDDLPQDFRLFRNTISFIKNNLARPITIEELATAAHLSVDQFRKQFSTEFGRTPQEFLLNARLQNASRALRSSSKPIAIIASECGFSDQSYFSKQFKRLFEDTPLRYRRRWRSNG